MATDIGLNRKVGNLALAIIGATVVGLVSIILFFTVGQPFGSLNDASIAVAAILSALLAWRLYPSHRPNSASLRPLAFALASAGALVVAIGAALVIFGITGWFLASLYFYFGNALVGLWLLVLTASAHPLLTSSRPLQVLGFITALVMSVGLLVTPGILHRVDVQASASWMVNLGQLGGLGFFILYPIWCFTLRRHLRSPYPSATPVLKS